MAPRSMCVFRLLVFVCVCVLILKYLYFFRVDVLHVLSSLIGASPRVRVSFVGVSVCVCALMQLGVSWLLVHEINRDRCFHSPVFQVCQNENT